jgi:hypothetical protein
VHDKTVALDIGNTFARIGMAVISFDGFQMGALAAAAKDQRNELRDLDTPDGLVPSRLCDWYARGTSRPYGRRIRDLRISRSIRDRCTSWGSPAAACRACTTEPLRDI